MTEKIALTVEILDSNHVKINGELIDAVKISHWLQTDDGIVAGHDAARTALYIIIMVRTMKEKGAPYIQRQVPALQAACAMLTKHGFWFPNGLWRVQYYSRCPYFRLEDGSVESEWSGLDKSKAVRITEHRVEEIMIVK